MYVHLATMCLPRVEGVLGRQALLAPAQPPGLLLNLLAPAQPLLSEQPWQEGQLVPLPHVVVVRLEDGGEAELDGVEPGAGGGGGAGAQGGGAGGRGRAAGGRGAGRGGGPPPEGGLALADLLGALPA